MEYTRPDDILVRSFTTGTGKVHSFLVAVDDEVSAGDPVAEIDVAGEIKQETAEWDCKITGFHYQVDDDVSVDDKLISVLRPAGDQDPPSN